MRLELEAKQYEIRFDLKEFLAGKKFGHRVCEMMVALAADDGHITIEEYTALLDVVDAASRTDMPSPQLFNALVCHYLLAPPRKVEEVAEDLKAARIDDKISDKACEAAFELLLPLIELQRQTREEHTATIRAALGLDGTLTRLGKGISRFFKTDSKSPEWVTRLRMLAHAYPGAGDALLQALEAWEKEPGDGAAVVVRDRFNDLRSSVLNAVTHFAQSGGEGSSNIANRAQELAEMLLEETAKRLLVAHKRMKLQHEIFVDDVEAFFDNAVTAFKAVALEQGRKTFATWDDFRKTAGGRAIHRPYEQLSERHELINRMWDTEIEAFTEELSRLKGVLGNFHTADFARMIPPRSLLAKSLDVADSASTVILKGAGIGAAGAAATGALFGVQTLGVIAGLISPPIALTVLGAIGAAALFKATTNKEDRHIAELIGKGQKVEANLRKMLDGSIEKHRSQLTELGERFCAAANDALLPVAVDLAVWRFLAESQPKIYERMVRQTSEVFRSATIPVFAGAESAAL